MDYSKKFFSSPSSRREKILLNVAKPFNKLFRKFNLPIEIVKSLNPVTDMVSDEQRINLYHLLNEIIINEVEGEIIELGCQVGNTAMQIQEILTASGTDKQFHVYDVFELPEYGENANIKEKFITNFKNNELVIPNIHEGFFANTIPAQLPDKLSFVHIDCGFGGDKEEHSKVIIDLLTHIYPRMSPKAICLFMDYHDPMKVVKGLDCNPGVTLACNHFFEKLPEKVYQLYGNHFSQGYFRKK